MGKIIGIDLGTSTSEVAIIKDDKPYIIKNSEGKGIIPSFVGKDEDGKIIVGEYAKVQMLLRPSDTVMEVKRLMGTDEKVKLGGQEYLPEEISAEILKYLKGYAEAYLGEEVDRAVITVPAYFSDNQRKATVKAGQLAGLQVERIINEPTAAALTYGIEHIEDESHVLVYDLGGGTLDVTELEMFAGVLDVKASSGNNKLGGKDFDEKLMQILLSKFNKDYSIDLSQNQIALARVKAEAEKCKIALSTEEEYKVEIPFIAEKNALPVVMCYVITRQEFENAILELINSTKEQIDIALNDAKLTKDDIDQILLVGGSTRIPLVKKLLNETLGKEPKALLDPDLAVAMGAAIQAGILEGQFSEEDGLMITDVCPYTLGVRVAVSTGFGFMDDYMSVIINRNTTIPVTKEEIYFTIFDYQDKAEINVYQGNEEIASKNNFLGKFILENIPSAKAGKEQVKVQFTYDVNGILKVDATVVSTGEEAGIQIETTGVNMEQEVDLDTWEEASKSAKYKRVIKRAEKLLNKVDEMYDVIDIGEDEDKQFLLEPELDEEISDKRTDIADEIFDAISDLLEYIKEIKTALVLEKSDEELEKLEEQLIESMNVVEELQG